MTKIFGSSLLLLLTAVQALTAGLPPSMSARLSELSAETFFEAISYEFNKKPELKPAIRSVKPGAAAALGAAAERGLTQAALFARVAALVPLSALDPAGRAAAARAMEEARVYISPEELPLWEDLPPRPPRGPPEDLKIYSDSTPETSGADPSLIEWKNSAGYASSRIGPLRALLDTLGPEDRIIFTNLPRRELPPALAGDGELTALRLPISGYAKKLWLSRQNGSRTLLITDFQGATFLRHFELLLKRYYSGKPGPSVTIAEARSSYEPYYRGLARVRAENPGVLDGLEGLIAGYAETFRIYWSSYSVTSVFDGEADWRVDTYRIPDKGLWGVISARSSYYGETLGGNIRYLVHDSTGIKTVLIAGSGGSLDPRPLYSLSYPSHILTPGGTLVPNALGSAADFSAHKSAVSPLEETPPWLAAALADGVSTVDVEMGPAAEMLSGLGLRLGFAVLVTDFPIHRPVIDKLMRQASLASQDAGSKYGALPGYAAGIEGWIKGGPPPGWQRIEKRLRRPLAEQSASNLASEMKRLAPMNSAEKKLVKKLEGYFTQSPPSFSVRMSTSRAARALGDEALLSTGLVSSLKGSSVNPFTPDYEQRSYGAYDYIFGTLSYWDGPEKYGDTVIRLKTPVWKARAWATRRSAMRALAIEAESAGLDIKVAGLTPGPAGKAEERFASWIVTPGDLPRALALQIIGELREMPAAAFKAFIKAKGKDLPGLIKKYDVGWLEGKIHGSARAEDIELIKTPLPVPEGISGPAGKLGIRIEPAGQ